jgi:hypothetical protein
MFDGVSKQSASLFEIVAGVKEAVARRRRSASSCRTAFSKNNVIVPLRSRGIEYNARGVWRGRVSGTATSAYAKEGHKWSTRLQHGEP